GQLAGGVAGAELLALLGAEVASGVAAHQEVVGAGLVGGTVVTEGLDLGDPRPGDDRDHQQEDEPERQQHAYDPEGAAAPSPAPSLATRLAGGLATAAGVVRGRAVTRCAALRAARIRVRPGPLTAGPRAPGGRGGLRRPG